MPLEGEFTMQDEVAGTLQVKYENLDDVTLLRSDGNPTYMIASVVDDEEHQITHLIRGQEHLYNTYRQLPILNALGYQVPCYAHIPLIHDQAGHKLSKRKDAVSVYDYQAMGILPEALTNYMLRLGWGHGDTDIIDMEEAKKIFSLGGLGKSPARFDQTKLNSLNAHYIKRMDNTRLLAKLELPAEIIAKLEKCLDNFKEKADSLQYINEMAYRIFALPIPHLFDPLPELSGHDSQVLMNLTERLDFQSPTGLKETLEQFVATHELDKKAIFMFLRVCLTGMKVSPGLFEVMYALGPSICQSRIQYHLG
jgi:glutamyl-tRNA synthetase